MKSLLIKTTAVFEPSTHTWEPSRIFSLHQRINHRGLLPSPYFHINNTWCREIDNSQPARQERYECNCLEKGIRPFNYPEDKWQKYLRYVADDEHFERCEAKNAHLYEY